MDLLKQNKYRLFFFIGLVFLGLAAVTTLSTPWGLALTIPATYIMLLGGINVANQQWPDQNYVQNYGLVGVIGNLLPFVATALFMVANSILLAVVTFFFVAVPLTVILASLHIGTAENGPSVMRQNNNQTNLVTYAARLIGIVWFSLGGILLLAGAISIWQAVIFATSAGICYVIYQANPDPVISLRE